MTTSRKYDDAEGYDAYMGGWSQELAPRLLPFAAISPTHILDVGCGTGNLLAAATTMFPDARLAGVDPSTALLARARSRLSAAGADLREGTAEAIPFPPGAFDCCVSLLVLQEFADIPVALCEMRRVTRRGGTIAACQWDFARMPVIASLVEAISAVSPEAGAPLRGTGSQTATVAGEGDLLQLWIDAGLGAVETRRFTVHRQFASFDRLWLPLLRGSTPSTLTLASLPPEQRAKVRAIMQRELAAHPGDHLTVAAEALVVRGAV